MASLKQLLELEEEKKRVELYRHTDPVEFPGMGSFAPGGGSAADIQAGYGPLEPFIPEPAKEFLPTGFKDSPELPSNNPLGRMRLPLERPLPPPLDPDTEGIPSLIPRLDILGDKPVYNTDNPLMDELLKLSKPKNNSNEEMAAMFFGMTHAEDRTLGAALGSGGEAALAYREKGKNRYLKAIGLGAVRQDQINKTQYQSDVDWQLANRQMDVDVWSTQTKADAKANLTSYDLQLAAAEEELKAMAKEIYGDPSNFGDIGMAAGELRTQRIKEYQERLIVRAIELKAGRPLPGGAADVTER